MAITKDTLLSLSKKLISSRNNNIDLTTGTVLSDLGVDATAQILASLSEDIDRIIEQQSLNSAYFTDEEADMLVQAFGITRKEPGIATGNVTFATRELPSASSPIIIPVGTQVYTSSENNSTSYYYETTSSGSITSTAPFNVNTGYYEVTVSIKAVSPGTDYNVGIGYINGLRSSITGVSAVYNKNAIVNGTDTESTDSLLNKFLIYWRGRNRNTEPGILAWTYENPVVEEAKVIGPNSDYSLRGPGAVDVYVRGITDLTYTQTVTTITKEVRFVKQPVINVDTLYVTVGTNNFTINDGVFAIVKDTETIYQGSNQAHDKLVWTDDGYEIVRNVASYTITYSYNSLIDDLQSMYDNDNERLITGDILARETYKVEVVMEFGITTFPGVDKATTISLVKTNIQNYVNTTPLNTDLKQSDIVAIIEGTDGVSFTELPFLQFHRVGETDEKKMVADIDSSPLEYFRVQNENIIIG